MGDDQPSAPEPCWTPFLDARNNWIQQRNNAALAYEPFLDRLVGRIPARHQGEARTAARDALLDCLAQYSGVGAFVTFAKPRIVKAIAIWARGQNFEGEFTGHS
jgi:hypothetical protein